MTLLAETQMMRRYGRSTHLNGVPKALERMEYPPTDSSDEELEREEAAELLALEGDSDEGEDEDM